MDYFDPTIDESFVKDDKRKDTYFDPTINNVASVNPTGQSPFEVSDMDNLRQQYGDIPAQDLPFTTDLKADYLDDPQSKLTYLADKLMPNDPNRYDYIGYVGNNIVFAPQDKDGNRSPRVIDPSWMQDVGTFAVREALPTAGAIAGSLAGPVGTAVGTMAGEGLNQAIGAGLGDEQSIAGATGQTFLAGITAYGGDLIGRGLANILQARKASRLASDTDASLQLNQRALDSMDNAQNVYGMKQFPHEATRSYNQANRAKVSAQSTDENAQRWGDFMVEERPAQIRQSEEVINRRIGGVDEPIDDMALKVQKQAAKRRENLVNARDKAAGKFYRKSFDQNLEVGIDDVVATFDKYLEKTQNTKLGQFLNAQKEKLYKTVTTINDQGEEVTEKVLKDNIGELHIVKEEWDRALSADPTLSADKRVKRIALELEKKLTRKLLRNQDYRLGYTAFKEASKPINVFDDTIVGKIARMEKELTAKDVDNIFFKATIPQIRAAQKELGEEQFNRIVSIKLKDAFRQLEDEQLAGRLSSKLFGKGERERWKAMLGEQRFQIMQEYVDLLKSFKRTADFGSPTQARQVTQSQMESEAMKRAGLKGTATKLFEGPFKIKDNIAQAVREKAWREYADEYINAIFSDNPARMLAELRGLQRMPKDSYKWMEKAGAIFGVSAANIPDQPEARLKAQKRNQTQGQ